MDIVILTEGKYVSPKEINWYTEQVLQEDGLLMKALEKRGFSCTKLDWADPNMDWSQPKACIFRSVWDYFHRFNEFERFLGKVDGLTHFINPITQIKWNMDKHYLLDLEQKGIPIVESCFLEIGDARTLEQIHKELGWQKTVLKPCVSGGGRHTYLLNSENYADHEEVYAELISKEAMILQPFQEQIIDKGEVSHMVMGGKYTHSVLKKAKDGDYRVQDDFGGAVHDYQASQEEIDFAEQVAKACDPLPAYARIDVVWDNEDKLAISEVELIEPELWFRKHPPAATLLADEIAKNL
ncbi:MAG: hypothetical protein HUJ25_14245 [Crocinitomicaceae bacterium]|nr:hypothetical protein [Crocinitomicaceae bacterium]